MFLVAQDQRQLSHQRDKCLFSEQAHSLPPQDGVHVRLRPTTAASIWSVFVGGNSGTMECAGAKSAAQLREFDKEARGVASCDSDLVLVIK